MKYIIGAVILLALIWIIFSYQKANSTQQNTIVTLWIPALSIIVAYTILLLTSKPAEPDYRDLNKPYLVSQIEILEASNGWYDFQFVIINKGKLPASNITYDVFSISSSMMENQVKGNRVIAPEEEFSFRPFFNMPMVERNSFDGISLVIYSSARIDGKESYFKDVFNFQVHFNQIIPGKVIRPSDKFGSQELREQYKSSFSPGNLSEQLNKPLGSLVFSFKVEDQPKQGNALFGSGTNKEIYFNPIQQEVNFSLILKKGEQFNLRRRISPAREMHTVVVTWNEATNEFVLVVDGDSPR